MGRQTRTNVAAGVALTRDEETELVSGPRAALRWGGHFDRAAIARGSIFLSPEDRLAAWEAHRDRLVVAVAADEAGHRPWATWVLDLERPDLATPYKEDDVGRVQLLAERGLLYEVEIAELERIGQEAEARIGTPHELRGPDPNDPNGWDKLEARVARVMREGLRR
jgi:hypothetical protein